MTEYIEDADGAPVVEPEVIGKLIGFLHEEGGHLTIVYNEDENQWLAGIEFGREAPDSPMAAGAAYQLNESLAEALTALVKECDL